MRTIATICARGGSKGLPRKNVLDFMGRPLIAHAIGDALACNDIDGVYVSTDCDEIASVSTQYGAQVLFKRPAHLSTDEAGKLPVIEHLVAYVEAVVGPVDRVVDLQPTSPLRVVDDIAACMKLSDRAGLITTAYDCGISPYFTMVETDSNGFARLCKQSSATRRQDAPRVLTLNGAVYVWQRAALASAAQNGLWQVSVQVVEMPKSRSADIDDLDDFEWALFLAQRSMTRLEGAGT